MIYCTIVIVNFLMNLQLPTMNFATILKTRDGRRKSKLQTNVCNSLSSYFPAGTCYFYGYPSGEESSFLNKVSPTVEELVSARPLVCGGSEIKIITFAAVANKNLDYQLNHKFGSPLVSTQQITALPEDIDSTVKGHIRNTLVKQSLKKLVKPGSLVMAQPFMDEDMHDLYQISPRLTVWLNDKLNMPSFIPDVFSAKRYGSFKNGPEFSGTQQVLPVPCVVKVSSSSAGDGVYICLDAESMTAVKAELKTIRGSIIVEQYINATTNYGVQFGIPENPEQPIDIIGISKQLTTTEGEFIGGIIDNNSRYDELNSAKQALLHEILPEVRKLGWYGVGCFDVLVDKDGKCYFIDCNFRMTGMTAYLLLHANRQITKSLVSFSGEFKGTLTQLEKAFNTLPKARDSLHVLTYTEGHQSCNFSAALLFDSNQEIGVMAQTLLKAGIASKALEQLSETY